MRASQTLRATFSYCSPIETFTFLTTDIEGSTKLLTRLGVEDYASALSDHHAIIREALRAHGGREKGTQGDSFLATFTSPSACVAAAVDAQRALGAHEWPCGQQLKVRMGIHSGEAADAETGLVGYEVHRAARIGEVGHGGQVLLSSVTAGLVEGALPAEVALQDLGIHRLKDLGRPESLLQLTAPGLCEKFPPLRSLDNPELPNNLPAALSPFVGRHDEVSRIAKLLEASRLVTLTGAGGSGKTRLALQVAAEVLDGSGEGVWFVELAPVSDAQRVPGAVLDALLLRQGTERDDLEALLHALQDQRCLVILDNCEHLIDAVAKLADLVGRTCPKVTLMATSREPLGVDGEEVLRVPSLSLPSADAESVAELAGSDAVDLFVSRTRSHDKGFVVTDSIAPLVASVCRRLDGIPLAIELAAARLSSMSLKDLHDRLDQRFRLLTGGSRNALPRQQTLGAMVAWSYDLLNPVEREVLRRLTVFVDGFPLEAAEAICATSTVDAFDITDILGSLVNKSLVVAERVAESLRYRLLETIRQFATEQLLQADGEVAALEGRRLHAEYFLALCEVAEPHLTSSSQAEWVWRLDVERGNILAALSYFAEAPDGAVEALRLGWSGIRFFAIRYVYEPMPILQDLLMRNPDVSKLALARGLVCLSMLEGYSPPRGEAMEAFRSIRDERVSRILALATELDDDLLLVWALIRLTFNMHAGGNDAGAVEHAVRAVETARRTRDPYEIGFALCAFGIVHVGQDEHREAYVEAAEQFRLAGTPSGLAYALLGLIAVALQESELEQALAFALEAVEAAHQVGANDLLLNLWDTLGIIEAIRRNFGAAEAYSRRSIVGVRRLGQPPYSAVFAILVLSCCASDGGDDERAARLYGAFESLEQQFPDNDTSWTPVEAEWRDGHGAALHRSLGDERFEIARTEGSRLTNEQTVDLALGR